MNQEFGVKASIKFDDAVAKGTVFTYTIPAGTYVKEAGSVPLQGSVKGTLAWSTDGEIKLTVSEDIPAGATGGFVFRSWVAESITKTPWELNYEMADQDVKTIDLTIKEATKPNPVFKKTGTNNGISYDTKTLTYTIEFSGVEGAEAVADKLPAGVTFKEITSVTRAPYNKYTGQYGAETDDKSAWSVEKTDAGFNLKRTGDIGLDKYKIVYTVDVKDPQGLNKVEANKVALVNNTSNVAEIASNTLEIKHADAYQKSSPNYDATNQTITWRIVYNLNGKNVGAQTINDYFSNDFEFGNLVVYKAKLEENANGSPKAVATTEKLSGFTATAQQDSNQNCPNAQTSCQHVAINMPAVGTDTYIIEYTTKAKDIVKGGTAYNQALIAGKTYPASRGLTNGLGVKKGINNDIDYINKTATWEITLNTTSTGKINAGAVITDTFKTKGMTLDKNSFVVKVAGVTFSLGNLGITIADINSGNGGFTLTFSKEIPKNTVIRYKTNFDIIGNEKEEIRNSAVIEYNKTTGSLDAWSQPVTPEALTDGNKSGVYNPDTKTITWTVNVNYYAKTIANPVLTDTLESNQTYVADSLKVYEASVSKDGKISRGVVKHQQRGQRQIMQAKKNSH